MTLENKQNIDALLRRWPALAPGKAKGVIEHEDNADWEARADAIVGAALAAKAVDASALSALEAPPLPIEIGEPEKAVGGENKMSQENEPGGPPTSGESSAAPVTTGAPATSTPIPERKRTSLKAFAEKASQAGARSSAVPSSSSGGASTSTPIPSAPSPSSRSSTSTPLPRPPASSQASSRPKEAGADDSGIVNLNVVRATATAQEIADAEKAKPGSEGLFDEDKPDVAKAKAANVIPIGNAKAAPKKSNGPLVGFVIAAVGVAAAFAIIKMQKPPAPTAVTEAKPAVTAMAMEARAIETAAPTAVAAADPTAVPITEPDKADVPRVAGGVVASNGASSAAPKDTPVEDGKVAAVDKPSAPTGKPGDLKSEMARAVGADGKPVDGAGTPEPAAGNAKAQNIPEQPSQGAVQSAIGAVVGGAKACVAGGDVSRAEVTFSSNGSVSKVAVTGWAASNGKSACVQAALKGAKVGSFSKPTYTLGVTIRP